jgi:hypothetical protein
LASFCVWTKSLKCKDAVNRDSTIQSLEVKRIQVPCHPFGRSNHPIRTPICLDDMFTVRTSKIDQHHPFGRSIHSIRTPYCIEKFLCQLASVRTFQQHVRTPLSTRSRPSSKKGTINQPFGSLSAVRTIDPSRPDTHLTTVPFVRTTCHTVRTPVRPSIIRPDYVHFRPDPPLSREVSIQLASVRMSQQPVRTLISALNQS